MSDRGDPAGGPAAPWPSSPPAAPAGLAETDASGPAPAPAAAASLEPPLTFAAAPGLLSPQPAVGSPPDPTTAVAPAPTGRRPAAATALLVPGAAVAAAVAVLATFLTWLRVGSSARTSYEVVRAAERLDVVGGQSQSAFAALWAFLPFAMALGGLALALGRRRTAAVVLLVAAVVEVAFATLVLQAPGLAGPGATLGLAASLALVALSIALLLVRPPRSSS